MPAKADNRIKIAVIDTGINYILPPGYLCDTGHRDFSVPYDRVVTNPELIKDQNGHGTIIADTIAKKLDITSYCLVIIKWIRYDASDKQIPDSQKILRVSNSVLWAIKVGVSYINMSMSGPNGNPGEKTAIEMALERNIKVFVAAGNDSADLDTHCRSFPACYGFKSSNFFVVGNYDGARYDYRSNYGGPINLTDYSIFGTSGATASALNKYIRGFSKNEKVCTSNTCSFSNDKLRKN